jgi:hypothetical protein
MKPMAITILILAIVIIYSALFFAEASGRRVSSAVNFLIIVPDAIIKSITQPGIPKITIDRIVVEQGRNDMTIYIYMTSFSTKTETVDVELIPTPILFQPLQEIKILAPGSNSPSIYINNVFGTGNLEIEIKINTKNGQLIASTKIYRSFNVVPDMSKSMLLACDSAKYCRDMERGSYCWGNTYGKYECHDSCGAIMAYAPSAENCCLNICSAVLKDGRCECKI